MKYLYTYSNFSTPFRINLYSYFYINQDDVRVKVDDSLYFLNKNNYFVNGYLKLNDNKDIRIEMDYGNKNSILIFYFPIDLYNYDYEIITKPNKNIITKSKYLIFQFNDDFYSFANLKIYSTKKFKNENYAYIFRYNMDNRYDIIRNKSYYFDFSQSYDLQFQNIYLDIDKPKYYIDSDIKSYITVFKNNTDISFDFQYFNLIKISSYERYRIVPKNYYSSTFGIYEYNNNPEFGKGEIFMEFFEIINDNIDLYIYREKKYIEYSSNNKFENYIKKINLKGQKQIILNETAMNFYDKGLFYFIFTTSDFSNKTIFFDLLVYNPNEYFLINRKLFKFAIPIKNNINLFFKFQNYSYPQKYLRYEWYHTNPNYASNIYFNSIFQVSGFTNYSFYEINNSLNDFNIIFINYNKNQNSESILYFLIHFQNEKSIYTLNNNEILYLYHFVAPQMIYLLNDISDEGIGETLYFKISGGNFETKPKVKFLNNINEILNNLPTKLEDFDDEMKIINGNYTCIKRDTKLVLIGINISFREWQYLSFQKIYSDIFVQSNYSRYFLNYSYIKLKTFYINKESFTNPNIKIIIFK